MNKPEKIQIDFNFFIDLYIYAYRHADPDDLQYQRIENAFMGKIDSMMRREMYTMYKTGATEEDRRKAREKYLDSIGLLESFRWDAKDDWNVTK